MGNGSKEKVRDRVGWSAAQVCGSRVWLSVLCGDFAEKASVSLRDFENISRDGVHFQLLEHLSSS